MELLHIPDLVQQDAGDALLQNIIYCLLQVGVQRQIDVPSRNGFHPALRIDLPLQIVHIDDLAPLLALQIRFHHAFDTGFSHRVVHLIPVLAGAVVGLLIQVFHFLCGNLSRIADDMRKIGAVDISADRILRNVYAGQRFLVLFYGGHSPLAHIRGDGGRYVFLIAVGPHGITDRHQL